MRCVVTAGPTFEPLDQVRRLTNFSTGRLGSSLAKSLAEAGHDVVLLRGIMSVHQASFPSNCRVVEFSTGTNLAENLEALSAAPAAAIFHAAAVSDFAFGHIWRRAESGKLEEVSSGKLSSQSGALLAELQPTPKILERLRGWFPASMIVGWKFEVEGDRASALAAGRRQIDTNQTDVCVVNGPAFGEGFGLLTRAGESRLLIDATQLIAALSDWLLTFSPPFRSRAG